jgi:hypothetical protein
MSMRVIVYTMACVATFYGFSAAAATVVPYSGDVFVNHGDGFHKINGSTPVNVGDSVMVSPHGLAQVRLDDGNIITVVPGQVLSVPLKARAKDAALPSGAGATADYPVAAPATAAGVPPVAGAATAAPADFWGPLAGVLLAAGGFAAAAVLASQPGPSPAPISP